MLRRYNPSIGTAKITCPHMSPPGVMMAAATKMMRIAYLKLNSRKRAGYQLHLRQEEHDRRQLKNEPEPEQHFRVQPEDIAQLRQEREFARS